MSKTGYIYKICCLDTEIKDCYVGSTKNEKVRKNGHKVRCNGGGDKSNYYVYQFIRENGGWENWNMIRLEEFKFDERAQLNARERYWLETLGATLNKQIPIRTQKEWREDNKEVLSEYSKEYNQNNREKIIEYKKEHYQKNKQQILEQRKEKITCECGTTLRKADKNRHLKSQKHKDYIISLDGQS